MSATLSGGCLCGAVRYTVEQSVRFDAYACHCTDCQTRSGSAFGIQQSVMANDLTVEGPLIRGEHIQPSGAVAGIYACEKCLTRIYTDNNNRPGIVNLRAGTLDTSYHLVPGAHLWTASKLPWVVIPDDAINLPGQPADQVGWIEILKPTPVESNG
ncbi:GFA family protein [Novosphingobium sp.]|uniref:GFA family protein n=1 Tax=Novosphingobium sp. TaxID=1874826 RepID=UPI0025D913F8|nr:GFA family protein [Novosphingobium sp.]MCC6926983.1 GFA family protein [Novosphingobium sp.]